MEAGDREVVDVEVGNREVVEKKEQPVLRDGRDPDM